MNPQFSKDTSQSYQDKTSRNGRACVGLELKLLTFNRQMRIFGIMQMNLQWEYAGSISAQLQISAIPLIADSASNRYLTHFSAAAAA